MNEKTETKAGPITESILVTGAICDHLLTMIAKLENKLGPIKLSPPSETLTAEERPAPECSEMEDRLLTIRRTLDSVAFRIECLTQEIRL